jgi:NAD(P)-dependent dehydrogenase (short-subunit alcohol dehydrogenase family)
MSEKSSKSSQSAIVTGSARGLGLGIAKRLAAEGKNVILWDLDFGAFDSTNAGFEPFLKQQVDVADLVSVQKAFAEAKEAISAPRSKSFRLQNLRVAALHSVGDMSAISLLPHSMQRHGQATLPRDPNFGNMRC